MILSALPLVAGLGLAAAAPSFEHETRATSLYQPIKAACPSTPLVRVANGISSAEASYAAARHPKACAALAKWLKTTGLDFPNAGTYPSLGLATSGGGLRALLVGAGIHKAFDDRDSKVSTSGLYQSLTYESGLSGGAWMLSSFAANNWPTVSTLRTELWNTAFKRGLSDPEGGNKAFDKIIEDMAAKGKAGFPEGVTDPYGRLLGYQLLTGADGGVAKVLSGVAALPGFTSHSFPFPIFTALGVNPKKNDGVPSDAATQYEFHPYEFGSWDSGVNAFTPTEFLGSALSNGKPTSPGKCVKRYDNQGFMLGTSSSLFNELALSNSSTAQSTISELEGLLSAAGESTNAETLFAAYPNPFYKYAHSNTVDGMKILSLVDGGEAFTNDPIWPFLHRDLDVLFVSDASADTGSQTANSHNNYPTGIELHETYLRAQKVGLKRMPFIPAASVIVAKKLNKRPVFFGCDEKDVMTIVWFPNQKYTYGSGTSTFKLVYSVIETGEMIGNGEQIATHGGDKDFGGCLGCVIMKKTGVALPKACTACFAKYCY